MSLLVILWESLDVKEQTQLESCSTEGQQMEEDSVVAQLKWHIDA